MEGTCVSPQHTGDEREATMTLVGALLGILGVAFFARWLLIGGDDGRYTRR
jgi:hypothetical protein